jgi:hypothetical protein
MRGHFWNVIEAVIAAVAVTGFGLGGAKAADIPGPPPAPPPPPSYGGPPPDVYAYPPPVAYEYAPPIGRGLADTERTGRMRGQATLFMGVAGNITAGEFRLSRTQCRSDDRHPSRPEAGRMP